MVALRSLGEVIVYLPYLFGFAPQNSLVLVSTLDKRLGPVSRMDLPDVTASRLRSMTPAFTRAEAQAVDAFVFADATVADSTVASTWRSVELAFAGPQGSTPLLSVKGTTPELRHLVRVSGLRWRSERCPGDCCPPGWRDVPAAADVAALADVVFSGVHPLASRTALEEGFSALPKKHQFAMPARSGPPALTALAAAWHRVLHGTCPVAELASRDVALAVRSLRDPWLWEALVPWIGEGAAARDAHASPFRPEHPLICELYDLAASVALPGGEPAVRNDRRDVRDRLRQVLRRLPESEIAPLAGLLAYSAWLAGDGAVALVAADRALAIEPDHELAQVVLKTVTCGIGPPAGHPSGR